MIFSMSPEGAFFSLCGEKGMRRFDLSDVHMLISISGRCVNCF